MNLKIKLIENGSTISAKLYQNDMIVDAELSEIIRVDKNSEVYRGDYEFTPTVDGGVLKTAQKLMEKDVVVNPIPTYEVSNDAGGTTFYIAKE